MKKEVIGDACAFIKGESGAKNRYVKIGVALKDGERISIKIDSLPFDPKWEGWINIFPRDLPSDNPRADYPTSLASLRSFEALDDDIPF